MPPAVRTIVDLGIGTGALARACLKSAPRARGLGIDADADMMATRTHSPGSPLTPRDDDHGQLPLDTALPPLRCDRLPAMRCITFDRQEKQAFYRRCYRALRPDGVLINGDCAPSSTHRGFARDLDVWFTHLGEGVRSRARGRRVYESWCTMDVYVPLADEIRLLERAGFAVDVARRPLPVRGHRRLASVL
jgi:SAM-dependent methyltransferase